MGMFDTWLIMNSLFVRKPIQNSDANFFYRTCGTWHGFKLAIICEVFELGPLANRFKCHNFIL